MSIITKSVLIQLNRDLEIQYNFNSMMYFESEEENLYLLKKDLLNNSCVCGVELLNLGYVAILQDTRKKTYKIISFFKENFEIFITYKNEQERDELLKKAEKELTYYLKNKEKLIYKAKKKLFNM